MEAQNKHFSHPHNLNHHHLPDGTEITCSGCNSSGTATVYACWPCNFFLHEQCFRAARSLQHPSHPSHPLTLLPYPTYPSNSFYCNSCNQIGTGFTYCCSDCEFDLHVQCAYSISLSSLLTPQAHILPQQNQAPNFNPHDVFLPHQVPAHQHISNPSANQQTFSSYNPQYASIPHQEPTNQPIIPSAPFLNYPIINETGPSFDVASYSPALHPSHNPQPILPSNHLQNYPPLSETVQNFNNPQNSHIPSQNPPIKETLQNINNPQNSQIFSHNPPIKETVQNYNHVQNYSQPSHNPQPVPNNPIPSYQSINETLPTLNVPQNSQISQAVSIPTPLPKAETYASSNATAGVPYKESTQKPQKSQIPQAVPIPTPLPKPETYASSNATTGVPQKESTPKPQNSQIPQAIPIPTPMLKAETYASSNATTGVPYKESTPKPQNSQIPQAVPIPTPLPKAETYASSNATTGVPYKESTPKPDQVKAREIMHFSHPHALLLMNPKAGVDPTKCSACEEIISGSRYSCSKSDCNFHLDESCFRLSQAILHKSHPDHPLTLLSYASDQYGQFICRACYKDAFGFTYHCTTCEFDLHIKCASLPETVKRDDHEHPLKLVYSCPNKGKEYAFYCDECGGIVQENWWTYYCEECDYGTHVDCDYHEESEETVVEESQNEKSEPSTANVNHDLEFQLEMQRLQLELEMAQQTAQMMASMGQSISNLAG